MCELANRLTDRAWIFPPTTNAYPAAGWVPPASVEADRLSTRTLQKLVGDSKTSQALRYDAIKALGTRPNHKEEAVPVLVEALLDPQPAIRTESARALKSLGCDATTGSESLDRALKNEADEIRYWFAHQARQAKSARQGVEAGLIVANLDVRIKAVELLGRMGDEGKPSAAMLRRLRDTCDEAELRGAVGLALGQLDGDGPIPELAKALKDPDPIVRGRAALQLGRMGKAGVPALRVALKENDADIRASTLGALGRIGAAAADAVPELVPLLKDENPLIRKLAADALRKIDPKALENR
jgi:HEAT repeat protein